MLLVVEEVDAVTRCVVKDFFFEVAEPSDLNLDPEIVAELAVAAFELTTDEGSSLAGRLGFAYDASNRLRLRSRRPLDDLSYKVHTCRELVLMLRGEKPLAAFCYADGEEFPEVCDQPFDEYVHLNRFHKREFSVESRASSDGGVDTVHWVLFALPSEEWRADAFQLLKRTAEKCVWTEGMERMEGTLLGYSEAQNDEFIERAFNTKD